MSNGPGPATAGALTSSRGLHYWIKAVVVLGLCGFAATASAAGAGKFVRVGDMSVERVGHSATLLADGTVLVAGGGTAEAAIYDPSTRQFRSTAPMTVSREHHTATLLQDGRVLIAGGRGRSSAEIYDPATGTFVETGAMVEDQFGHTATLLANGKVLIAGGERTHPPYPTAAHAELYDPSTGSFTPAGRYATTNAQYPDAGGPVWPTANMLPDGRVLLAGNNPTEIYDPSTDTFGAGERLANPAYWFGTYWHTATTLRSGMILIAGGSDEWSCNPYDSAELYDPVSGAFKAIGRMTAVRDLHSATLLRDGTVLIAGGGSGGCGLPTTASAELFDPESGAFRANGQMTCRRSGHTATLLRDGTVLITGGFSYWPHERLRSAELYVPSQQWRTRRPSRR